MIMFHCKFQSKPHKDWIFMHVKDWHYASAITVRPRETKGGREEERESDEYVQYYF